MVKTTVGSGTEIGSATLKPLYITVAHGRPWAVVGEVCEAKQRVASLKSKYAGIPNDGIGSNKKHCYFWIEIKRFEGK